MTFKIQMTERKSLSGKAFIGKYELDPFGEKIVNSNVTLSGIPAPVRLTEPKTPSFCKPRTSVVRHTGGHHLKSDIPSNRLSLNLNNLKARPLFGLKPAKPSGGILKPIKQSFGFLRPTQSSMAKQTSGTHLSGKLEAVKEVVEIEKIVDEKRGKEQQENCERGKTVKTIKTSKESLNGEVAGASETSDSAPSTLSNSFIIFEGLDESPGANLASATEVSPIMDNNSLRRQTIIPTPKFPKSRSVEKNTKRKLSFVNVTNRFRYPQERLRCTYSPPPDFDVTINSATMSPTYVAPAANYDCFSTPIMNLTAALSITDDDGDESVYYTPCAEI
ncbi:unnamed protein product [Allacma fusca]|uniref:Uncharacterized protein n=1 Tax=Allacma fusca TaxID=39272 RepID=A0A8J2LTW8_9HEXA|nr:unnamed protein product [Allacma fusca]